MDYMYVADAGATSLWVFLGPAIGCVVVMGIILYHYHIRQWIDNKDRLSKDESEKLGVSLAYILAVDGSEQDARGKAQTMIQNNDRYNPTCQPNCKSCLSCQPNTYGNNPTFYDIKVYPLCFLLYNLSCHIWQGRDG